MRGVQEVSTDFSLLHVLIFKIFSTIVATKVFEYVY